MILNDLNTVVAQAKTDGLAWGTALIGESATLFPAEKRGLERAVPARQAEFKAGRLAARRALAAADYPIMAIPKADDRAPVWPKGIKGSLSHAGGVAVVVLTDDPYVAAIGVDIEPNAPLDADLAPEICLDGEVTAARDARAVFSAKEAVYKAQYPLTHTVFGFQALQLGDDVARMRDVAETAPIPPKMRARDWPVRQWTTPDLILSLCVLPH